MRKEKRTVEKRSGIGCPLTSITTSSPSSSSPLSCSPYAPTSSASYYLSSLINSDPSLKSLLSRLDFSASSQLHRPPPHRRRTFLHLSHVGTLDDDFFSGDSDFDRSLFHHSSRKHAAISTSVVLKPGVFSFKPEFRKNVTLLEEDDSKFVEKRLDDGKVVLDLDFLIKGVLIGESRCVIAFLLRRCVAPWVIGHEWERRVHGGLVLERRVAQVAVCNGFWVAIVDSRRGGREIVREGRLQKVIVCMLCFNSFYL
ncbi:hypothetical protein SASPL_120897 [Salvia splendens]|uniref:Uncharacterized protein n=1 Tax=Salvia splendens TaxID=180675 RepID=A0A8X8ZVQ1_SALSN|nr:hypothetical protein SASPL_120897 [Salvia splendens]